ncbi:hypothetical protein BDZ89DRAFT_833715 [Hymenopellis radicata]|nr:hypothetical protein BDZ89DRAFT_833715 [Hymenopellis radicata]
MTQLPEKPQPMRCTTMEDDDEHDEEQDESDADDEKEQLLRRWRQQYPIDPRFHQLTLAAPWNFSLPFLMRKRALEKNEQGYLRQAVLGAVQIQAGSEPYYYGDTEGRWQEDTWQIINAGEEEKEVVPLRMLGEAVDPLTTYSWGSVPLRLGTSNLTGAGSLPHVGTINIHRILTVILRRW